MRLLNAIKMNLKRVLELFGVVLCSLEFVEIRLTRVLYSCIYPDYECNVARAALACSEFK